MEGCHMVGCLNGLCMDRLCHRLSDGCRTARNEFVANEAHMGHI